MTLRREADGAQLRLEFTAAHAVGRQARAELRQFGAEHGMDSSALEILEFVAGELIDNAIDHGGGAGAREACDVLDGAQVGARLHVAAERWVLSVADHDGELDHRLQTQITAAKEGSLDPLGERGRGLFLLSRMVDVLDVRAREGGCGVVFRVEKALGEQD